MSKNGSHTTSRWLATAFVVALVSLVLIDVAVGLPFSAFLAVASALFLTGFALDRIVNRGKSIRKLNEERFVQIWVDDDAIMLTDDFNFGEGCFVNVQPGGYLITPEYDQSQKAIAAVTICHEDTNTDGIIDKTSFSIIVRFGYVFIIGKSASESSEARKQARFLAGSGLMSPAFSPIEVGGKNIGVMVEPLGGNGEYRFSIDNRLLRGFLS